MKRFYIDFDGTLFDTDKMGTALNDYLSEHTKKLTNENSADVLLKIINYRKVDNLNYYQICENLETEYKLAKGTLKTKLDEFLLDDKKFLFEDSVSFLQKLQEQEFEVNLLTYSSKNNKDYQMKKIMGSGLLNLTDSIIICTKPKGELWLDYENGIFIDDNPKQLLSLFKAGVKNTQIYRIIREGTKYSNVVLEEFEPIEIKSFKNIKL